MGPVGAPFGEKKPLGMAANAGGEMGWSSEASGREVGLDGIGHGLPDGGPHRSEFPAKELFSWFKNTVESGISPVKLLYEKSKVAFSGMLCANSGGISPEILLYEIFK
uniref:Uncharacterized protein n=1 Tax=Opuntia streptacantha TaxID=393608 RepID=A0A7C8ZNE3_OPUST